MTDIRKNLIIRTNGKVEPIEINGYQGLKAAVGGLIEACIGGDDYTLWANESGRLMGLPMNQVAREFVAEMKQIPISNVLSLHGDMGISRARRRRRRHRYARTHSYNRRRTIYV